jgi:predicted ATP-grasp superfamily ATP-dependent carboligase
MYQTPAGGSLVLQRDDKGAWEKVTQTRQAAARADLNGGPHGGDDRYDILILDGGSRQSLVSTRSLGRAGLRVAVAECFAECDPRLPVLSFRSRYAARTVVLPNYADDAAAFADGVVDFVRDHPTRVVLPTSDGSIAALSPRREQLQQLGCVLALAPASVLDATNDKDQTLAVARKLGIPFPETMLLTSMDDLPAMAARFGFPVVLKPTISWASRCTARLQATEVINEAEAADVIGRYFDAGASVLAQEYLRGPREGVTMFVINGQILAACVHFAHRTTPLLGGASAMRQSLPLLPDIYEPSRDLVLAVGMQGICEVEYRRDSAGRPKLMEINTRLAGTIYNAVHSGVDFPLWIWRWASGEDLSGETGPAPYKSGVRTRWLHGDMRWLRDNRRRPGRPDSVSGARAVWVFGSEFFRTRHYDGWSWRDPGPAIAECRITAAAVRKSAHKKGEK